MVRDNNSNGLNRLLDRLAADKKKGIMALGLIVVMVFMWIRVISGKSPEAAHGAVISPGMNSGSSESKPELKVSFVELPYIEGRHNELVRDFFEIDQEIFAGCGEVNIVSENSREGIVRRVAEKLKLEAIGLGENPQAFINDKLVSVGDTLLVKDGNRTYECEIVAIENSAVSVRYEQAEIKLKLKQITDQ